MNLHDHCSWCGAAFPPAVRQGWPRTCPACQNTTWRNPLPVTVVLLPVEAGLLLVRRAIPPAVGKLALPGGFVNHGESWQAAGAREVYEETGIRIDSASLHEFAVHSTPDGNNVLIFGLAAAVKKADLPEFVANEEVSERLLAFSPCDLAFPLHAQVMQQYFASRG